MPPVHQDSPSALRSKSGKIFTPVSENLFLYLGGAGDLVPFPCVVRKTLGWGYGPTRLGEGFFEGLRRITGDATPSFFGLDHSEKLLALEILKRQRKEYPKGKLLLMGHSYGAGTLFEILSEADLGSAFVLAVDPVGWIQILRRVFFRGELSAPANPRHMLMVVELNGRTFNCKSNLIAKIGGHWPDFAMLKKDLENAADVYIKAKHVNHGEISALLETGIGQESISLAERIKDFFRPAENGIGQKNGLLPGLNPSEEGRPKAPA